VHKLPLRPIDETARNGRYQLVSDGVRFAVARWRDGVFEFSNDLPIGFEPHGYYVAGAEA
jgi:putative heme iron utilization protein